MTAAGSPRALVHPRVRSAFREAASDRGVVRQIERAFEDLGIDAAADEDRAWSAPGQRRGTFDRYTATTDWTDPAQVRRVLNVFEQILSSRGPSKATTETTSSDISGATATTSMSAAGSGEARLRRSPTSRLSR
jgi:hypothetical protein